MGWVRDTLKPGTMVPGFLGLRIMGPKMRIDVQILSSRLTATWDWCIAAREELPGCVLCISFGSNVLDVPQTSGGIVRKTRLGDLKLSHLTQI